jgi:hypothetical protein
MAAVRRDGRRPAALALWRPDGEPHATLRYYDGAILLYKASKRALEQLFVPLFMLLLLVFWFGAIMFEIEWYVPHMPPRRPGARGPAQLSCPVGVLARC